MAVLGESQLGFLAIVAILTVVALHSWLLRNTKLLAPETPSASAKDCLSGSNESAEPESSATSVKKYLTCRIRGVPLNWRVDELQNHIGVAAQVKSLALEIDGRSRTGTAIFSGDYPRRIPIDSSPSGEFLTVDQCFLGITTLYSPDDPKIDVIAVSGLGGHAFGSFKERRGDHMWLRDSLPHDILDQNTKRPIARIMTYGHDSHITESHDMQELLDISISFRESILQLAAASRPIVFIGHSLGGLIVKQALVSLLASSSKHQDEYQRLARATRGIIFFGVPHDGMDIDALRRVAGDKMSRSLIESLSDKNSSVLSNLRRDFNKLLDVSGAETFCFYETRESHTLRERAVEAKCNPMNAQTMECLKSLAFPEMNNRSNDIDTEADGTCKWLLDHDVYRNWKLSDRGLLWIKGKPGSGKSTLLRYALKHAEATPNIRNGAVLASYFFHGRGTDLQRTPLGLFRSILHQVLTEVPNASPDLVATFISRQETSSEWQWHQNELQGFLKTSLTNVLESRHVWLFIDALDESGEHARRLIENFQLLLKGISQNSFSLRICFACRHYPILGGDSNVEICTEKENAQDISTYVQAKLSAAITSKVPNSISQAIINGASGVFMWARLAVELVQDRDCQGWGWKKIEEDIKSVPSDLDELYQGLVQGIRERPASLKLIQWICFATRPLSLAELHCAMVLDPACPHKSLRQYKQCQQCQQRPEAGDYDSGRMERRVKFLTCGLAETAATGREVVQFIHQSVKDFLVDKGLRILTDNSTIADSASTKYIVAIAHYSIYRLCILCLEMDDIRQPTFHIENGSRLIFPLLLYVTTSWMTHLHESQAISACSIGLGGNVDDYLIYPSNIFVQRWVQTYRAINNICPPPTGTTPAHVASQYNLIDWLKEILHQAERIDTVLNARDIRGRTPLAIAARYKHEAVVKLLIDSGNVDLNCKDRLGKTPLLEAAENGHDGIVKLFLDQGREAAVTQHATGTIAGGLGNSKEIMTMPLEQRGEKMTFTKPMTKVAAGNRRCGKEVLALLFNRQGGKVIITEEVVKAAAGNSEGALALLLNQRGDEVIITEEVVKAAAGSSTSGALALLLNRRGDEITISEELVKAAAGNRNSEGALALLLNQRGDEVIITEEVVIAAVRGGRGSLALLLDQRGDEVIITEEVVIAAVRGGRGSLALLLDQRGDEVIITEEVVKVAARYSKEALALLHQRGDEVIITEDVLKKKAVKNSFVGGGALALLLDQRGDEVIITEEVVKAAVKNSFFGEGALALLLDQRGDEVIITEEVVKAAARNNNAALELLLDQRGDEVIITEDVLKKAAKNKYSSVGALALLLDQRGDEVIITEEVERIAAWHNKEALALLLDQRGDEVIITEEVVRIAAWHNKEALALLLDQRGDEVIITEEIVIAAVGHGEKALAQLLNQRGDEVVITEEVVKAAAWHSKEALALLLDWCGDEIAITEEVVKAAVGNSEEALELLLDRRGDEVIITEEVVKAAEGNSEEALALLLDRRGDEIIITEEVVKAAATSGQDDVLDLLSQGGFPVVDKWRRIAKFFNAADTGDIASINRLLKDGIEPDMENIYGTTPLWIAAARGHKAVVEILTRRKDVNVNTKSITGESPLFCSSMEGDVEAALAFMKAGAATDIMNENGDTPVTVAKRHGHTKVVKILQGQLD
ncbi:hypothetical protein QQS21_010345 [Conoideocrella luteorostrata]|uniref:Nephrocystin 3-like N-terminal domain-containing protein n=1 Tax=Conoideocrella luteorostrata TaxID=1105319 RepID=A0AAJ0FUT0_9HYPO|nr:hypothetical protein QQS21_010345 [Conoideocrella luteorostrata]